MSNVIILCQVKIL